MHQHSLNKKIYTYDIGSADVVIGVAAKQANSVDYDLPSEEKRRKEKSLIGLITAIEPQNIVFLNQMHHDHIIICNTYPLQDFTDVGDADAAITNLPGLCLVIRTADCVPVFLFDNKKKALGAVHSGWKGTRLEIAQKTAIQMINEYRCNVKDLSAYILPSIGPDSYEVQRDVYDLFEKGKVMKGERLFLNLWENIALSLAEIGIAKEKIHNAKRCTKMESDIFFSYRAGDSGRNLNFGYIKV